MRDASGSRVGPRSRRFWRFRRTGAAMALAIALAGIAAPAAFAAEPVTVPMEPSVSEFGPNEVCEDAVRVETPRLRGTTTTFPKGRNGVVLDISVGYATTLVTNVESRATYTFRGSFLISIVTFRDGSQRADAFGPGVWAWYLAGDPSELGTGLFQIKRHASETYDAAGNMVKATADGPTTDLCAKVGSGPVMP